MPQRLQRLGRFCAQHRRTVLVSWLVLALGLGLLGRQVHQEASSNLTLPGSGTQQVEDLLRRYFPQESTGTSPIAFRARTGVRLTDPRVRRAIVRVTRS